MASFFSELWQSVFSPGASPQLLVATHVSFLFLTACLAWLIFLTRNVHFMALLVISTLLWITVTWFVAELKIAQLKSNDELVEGKGTETEGAQSQDIEPKAGSSPKSASSPKATSSAVNKGTAKSRKV